MSEYINALDAYLSAREEAARVPCALADCDLAAAGDRLERATREMMRDEANKVSTELYGYPGMR